ncbi:MAG: hypothetical protein ACOH2F_20425 [Cellulomonas sp.]
MTPRLKLSAHDQSSIDVFASTPELRNLQIVIDDEAFPLESPQGWNWQALLHGLLTHENVKAVRYRDDGPPAGTPRLSLLDNALNAPIGWLEVTPASGDTLASHEVRSSDGETISTTAIVGDAIDHAERDVRTVAYAALPPDEAAAARRADAIAVQAVQACSADIFVTEREYLHAVRWAVTDGVTICTPQEALALVGLYLRTRGEFLEWKGQDVTVRTSKAGYFMVGARGLLPGGWKWARACVEDDRANGTEELTHLAAAVFQRVSRALQARDGLLRALSVRQNPNAVEDALREFDACTVFLMGALDAAARVAHYVVGHPGKMKNAGWQRADWMAEIALRCPELGVVLQAGSANLHALTILRLMRNTVHDAGLRAVNLRQIAQPDQTLIGLPRSAQDEVVEAVAALGGFPAWGLNELAPGRLHADPHAFLEALFPATLALLNDLLEATPVEALPGYSLADDDTRPPEGAGIYGPQSRDSIRWQLGLQVGGLAPSVARQERPTGRNMPVSR